MAFSYSLWNSKHYSENFSIYRVDTCFHKFSDMILVTIRIMKEKLYFILFYFSFLFSFQFIFLSWELGLEFSMTSHDHMLQ